MCRACRAWMCLYLFGSHVRDGTRDIFSTLVGTTLRGEGDAKIAQQDLVVAPQQHIFGLDVSMNQSLRMRVVQGIRHLLDVCHYMQQLYACSFGMTIA